MQAPRSRTPTAGCGSGLLTRPDIDPERITLLGRSWGGYLAPRAATGEHRFAALIADAAQYSPGARAMALIAEEDRNNPDAIDADTFNPGFEQMMANDPGFAFSINRGLLIHGAATPLDFLKLYPPYSIKGVADQISCPTLICEG